MPTVSVVMITLNEEEILPHSLSRLRWADEIVVVDSHSTDRTREIAAEAGAKVFTRAFKDFSDQTNWAMAQATGDWIFIIDADEMVTPALRDSVRRTVESNPSIDIFYIALDSYVLGRRMKARSLSGEWHPRLFRRGTIEYVGAVHQDPQIGGRPTGKLDGKVLHYTARSIVGTFKKSEKYALLWAEKAYAAGRRTNLPKAIASALWRTFHNYFIRGEIRDGTIGLFCSIGTGMHTFTRHMQLWGMQHREEFARVYEEEEDGADGK